MSTALASNTVALTSDWLNYSVSAVPVVNNNLSVGSRVSGSYIGEYWYPYYTATFWDIREPARIRLKLSEVERLREAARGDEALRATLNKFTPYIEVEVDF